MNDPRSQKTVRKVLLLNPPGDKAYLRDYYCSSVSKSGYYWHPIDLLVLSGRLHSEGYRLAVVDAIAEALSFEACFRRITHWKPDIVIFLTGASSWLKDRSFLERIADTTRARMIGCGEIFLGSVDRLFEENPWLEAGIRNFTDPGIPGYLESGTLTRGIFERGRREEGEGVLLGHDSGGRVDAGNSLETGNGIVASTSLPNRKKKDLLSYGVPRHELFPLKRYHYPWNRYHPFVSVLTAYGCPFACKFCNSGYLGFQLRALEDIFQELCRVREMGIRQIFVKDMSFGADREHALAFCRLIREHGFVLSWNCYARLDTLNEDLLVAMLKAGCYLIQVGLETASPSVAKHMGKPLNKDKARKIFRICSRLGIRTGAHFVLGLPGEDEKGVEDTIAFARELNPDYCSFNLFMPRYGSPLGHLIEGEGSSKEDGSKVVDLGGSVFEYAAFDHAEAWRGDPSLDPSEAYPFRSFCSVDTQRLFELRNRAYRSFYLRPGYLIRQGIRWRTPAELAGAVKDAWGLGKSLARLSVLSVFKRRDKRVKRQE